TTTNFITDNWIMVSILIKLALAILMIYIAVRCVEPVKRRRKNGKKGVNHGNY
ncbi:MAG: ABC transporter permease, partial [Clostridium sp.]|nr:ABC transporter permease [Clostridium sp.]